MNLLTSYLGNDDIYDDDEDDEDDNDQSNDNPIQQMMEIAINNSQTITMLNLVQLQTILQHTNN